MIRFLRNGFLVCLISFLVLPATGMRKKSPFGYCGGWIGQHSGSNRIGKGTAELIAPSWAITAAHVAKPKATNPGQRHVQINFGGHKAGVVKAYVAPQGDLALGVCADEALKERFLRPLTRLAKRAERYLMHLSLIHI